MQRNFFNHETVRRKKKIRPLSIISDFVVEKQPTFLKPCKTHGSDYANELEKLEEHLTQDNFQKYLKLEEGLQRIALVDMVILSHTAQHLGKCFPEKLFFLKQSLANQFQRAPVMLYEDNIMFNPLEEDPRLFFQEEVGSSELDFLWVHNEIEKNLEKVIDILMSVLNYSPNGKSSHHLEYKYQIAMEALNHVIELFTCMKHMSLHDFRLFRAYYAAPKSSRDYGVSGRFSETLNTLRILLEGKRIAEIIPDYFIELLENQRYYPSVGKKRMLEVMQKNLFKNGNKANNLYDLSQNPKWHHLEPIVEQIRDTLDIMTKAHLGLTKKYVLNDLEQNEKKSS